MHRLPGLQKKKPFNRLAIVLGTNEVASAAAVYLKKTGRDVILSHDPLPPVMRRGMAFYDALFGDPARLEGIEAKRIDFILEAYAVFAEENQVAITPLGLTELLVLGQIDLLVDARMQKYAEKPDLRGLAKVSVGLGPGFHVNGNCDLAIDTKPGLQSMILRQGITQEPDGKSILLGNVGAERFVRAEENGRWHTSLELGMRVYKDVILGHLNGEPVRAPFDGILRGLVRDGTEVFSGLKLIEIDPRAGRAAKWSGIDERPRQIASTTRLAVEIYENEHGLNMREPLYQ